jgi:DNA-binding transcriptional regulator YhcF (GntR family)
VIVIDAASSVPPFEQLRAQLVDAVSSGELVPGERLPTVRHLAEELGVAPGTVARAYRELETAAVIETRGRNGSFVRGGEDPVREQARHAAEVFAQQMRTLHLDADQALALAAAALRSGPAELV